MTSDEFCSAYTYKAYIVDSVGDYHGYDLHTDSIGLEHFP